MELNREQRRAYVRRAKVYRLVFDDDDDMTGLEVRARSVPLGTFMELLELADSFDGDEDTATMSAEDADAIRKLFAGFADALVSWNLEEPVLDAQGDETGATVPVPCTLDGLYSQDLGFVFQVLRRWMDAIASVSGPLGQPSPDGSQSLAASMPMETLSPSLAS